MNKTGHNLESLQHAVASLNIELFDFIELNNAIIQTCGIIHHFDTKRLQKQKWLNGGSAEVKSRVISCGIYAHERVTTRSSAIVRASTRWSADPRFSAFKRGPLFRLQP